MELFDDVVDKVSSAATDFANTGAPALIAGYESYAATQLSSAAQANQAQATAALQEVVNRPGPSTGIAASVQSMFSSIGQNAVVKQYGVYILGGAAVLIFLGIYIRK